MDGSLLKRMLAAILCKKSLVYGKELIIFCPSEGIKTHKSIGGQRNEYRPQPHRYSSIPSPLIYVRPAQLSIPLGCLRAFSIASPPLQRDSKLFAPWIYQSAW